MTHHYIEELEILRRLGEVTYRLSRLNPSIDDDFPPKECGAETEMGYGLAGGGIGPYVYCTQCDYFVKSQDPEMEEPSDARTIHKDARPVQEGGSRD